MNNLDRIFSEKPAAEAYAQSYVEYLSTVLAKLDFKAIAQFAEILDSARLAGHKIFFIGNGGSAATASHFANDLQVGPTKDTKKSFKAIALTDNNAIMTCIGNDFGYDDIFRRQLEVLMEKGDIVVALSASGNSPNIIKAVEFAKSQGNTVVGLSGFDGGQLKKLSDCNINIETPKAEYGPVEDGHMVLDHLVSTYLMRRIKQNL